MKHFFGKGFVTRENLFSAVSLFFYALILLVSDPAWLTWAGPILLGAFPTEAPATPTLAAPLETLQAASYWILPGLLALLVLVGIHDLARASRRAPSPGAPAPEMDGAAHGLPGNRKAA